jgi:hypothetical protein
MTPSIRNGTRSITAATLACPFPISDFHVLESDRHFMNPNKNLVHVGLSEQVIARLCRGWARVVRSKASRHECTHSSWRQPYCGNHRYVPLATPESNPFEVRSSLLSIHVPRNNLCCLLGSASARCPANLRRKNNHERD